jgi:hypothetical protein
MADDTFKDFQDFIGLSEDQIITLTDNLRIFYIAFSLFLLFSIYEFYVTRLYQQVFIIIINKDDSSTLNLVNEVSSRNAKKNIKGGSTIKI